MVEGTADPRVSSHDQSWSSLKSIWTPLDHTIEHNTISCLVIFPSCVTTVSIGRRCSCLVASWKGIKCAMTAKIATISFLFKHNKLPVVDPHQAFGKEPSYKEEWKSLHLFKNLMFSVTNQYHTKVSYLSQATKSCYFAWLNCAIFQGRNHHSLIPFYMFLNIGLLMWRKKHRRLLESCVCCTFSAFNTAFLFSLLPFLARLPSGKGACRGGRTGRWPRVYNAGANQRKKLQKLHFIKMV